MCVIIGRYSLPHPRVDDVLEADLTGQFVPILGRWRDKSLQAHEIHSAQ